MATRLWRVHFSFSGFHVVLNPVQITIHICINTRYVFAATAYSPADDSNEIHPIILHTDQRPSRVTLQRSRRLITISFLVGFVLLLPPLTGFSGVHGNTLCSMLTNQELLVTALPHFCVLDSLNAPLMGRHPKKPNTKASNSIWLSWNVGEMLVRTKEGILLFKLIHRSRVACTAVCIKELFKWKGCGLNALLFPHSPPSLAFVTIFSALLSRAALVFSYRTPCWVFCIAHIGENIRKCCWGGVSCADLCHFLYLGFSVCGVLVKCGLLF